MTELECVIQGLQIFATYDEEGAMYTDSYQNRLHVALVGATLSEEDRTKLCSLGWYAAPGEDDKFASQWCY